MIENPKQLQASTEFTNTICKKLANERGVHAETAIAAASRMAGTMLLRSSGLPMAQFAPGTNVFFDAIDDAGEQLMGTVGETLASLAVPFDPERLQFDRPEANSPMMGLAETQSMLDGPFRAILAKHELTEQEGAEAAAVSAAVLIQKSAAFLDPHISYLIAATGMVEAAKTVPWVS